MQYSVRVGALKGTPVYLHVSLVLVLPFYAVLFAAIDLDLIGYPLGFSESGYSYWTKLVLGAVLALFFYLAIFIHEAGHAWAARHRGYQVTGITLLFIGGVTEMEHPKEWPRGEADVAMAGAIISVGVGLVLLMVYFITNTLYDGWTALIAEIALSGFGLFNFFLGAMNALPILPMDGGMLLRDMLRADLGMEKASAVTVLVSRVAAIAMAVIGLIILNWVLFLVGMILLVAISPKQLES